MTKKVKSWAEKREEANAKYGEVKPVTKDMMGMKKGQMMLIPSPILVEDALEAIPPGDIKDTKYLRSILAAQRHAEVTCPVTTGIFLRIVAESAHEWHEQGTPISQLPPFWRVLGENAPLRKKVSFDLAPYLAQQAAEIPS